MIALATSADIARAGLSAYYLMEGSGQELTDSSAAENHGDLGANSSPASDDPTRTATGLQFDAVADLCNIPTVVYSGAAALTVQLVIKKTTAQLGGVAAYFAGGSYFRFNVNNRIDLNLDVTGTDAFLASDPASVTDDQTWKMLSFRWKSGVIQQIILNAGTIIGTDVATPATGTLTKGFNRLGSYAGGAFYGGDMAAAIYYQRSIELGELAHNYNVVKGVLAPRGIALP